jgi:CHAD domain-containing protein
MSFQWSQTDATAGDGFLRIAREQIAKAIATAEDLSESAEKRVHEARRRCKKLRALIRLVRPDFPDYARENAFVRDASRGLAGARDERVIHRTYEALMDWAGRPVAPADDTPPREPAGEEQALAAFAGQMRALQARSTRWTLGRIDLDTLATGLKHTYRRARWTKRFAERHRTDDAFHEWRKYAKYHWNQLGLLEDCAGDVLPSAHKSAGDLAEVLGIHHDLSVLEQVLATSPAQLGTDIDAGFLHEAIGRRRAELETRIAILGQQVFAERPKALKARFAAYLEGWAVREAAE